MPVRFDPDLIPSNRTELSAMSHEELEDLAWRQGEALRSLANRSETEIAEMQTHGHKIANEVAEIIDEVRRNTPAEMR